jgi:hypothetical protein
MPTAAILNQERERWARNQTTSLSAQTSAFSGALPKQTNKVLSASQSAWSGLLNKITAMGGSELAASMSSFSGSLVKQTNKILAATQSAFSGVLVKLTSKILSAIESAFVGSLVKQTNKILSATQTSFSGVLVKLTNKVLSATETAFVGTLVRQTNKILSAAQTAFSGALAASHLFIKVLSATMSTFSGAISKQAGKVLVATASAFSGTLNKFTSKFFQAVSSVWSAILNATNPHPVPSVFTPTSIGPVIASFGVSTSLASEIDKFSPQIQTFYSPGNITGTSFGTADGWGNMGQAAMPDQLLLAPGSGGLGDKFYYVVAGGDVTLPASASGVSLTITLSENYFSPGQVQSDPLSVILPIVQAGATTSWSIVCRLSGNGRLDGFLKAETVVGGQVVNTMYSNRNPQVEPKLQLSVGVNLTGSASSLPQVRMMQFEIQRG